MSVEELNVNELLKRCRNNKDSIRNPDTSVYLGTSKGVTWETYCPCWCSA